MNIDANLENEVKQMIIDVLQLEDITPADIVTEDPLFGEGLGLDSIDALELGVALQKNYDIKLNPESDDTKRYFSSVASLCQLISEKRAGGE